MRTLYKFLSFWGDAKALSRGPAPYARRAGRKHINRVGNRWLRKVLKP